MDAKSIKKRLKSSGGKTDDQLANEYIKVVESKFPNTVGKGLNYLYLDACYDDEDEEEEAAFKKAMDELYQMCESNSQGLPTNRINDKVSKLCSGSAQALFKVFK